MTTIKLTMAQALVRYLAAQKTEIQGQVVPLFAGVWAIFGHGNVAGIGHALADAAEVLPTWRGQNEQSMAHAATAFAKANCRRRMLAVTTSIGPGATNLVTAAATAFVNRLPILLLPGDIFANRLPDPVLQQLECFNDATLSVNDCLKPVSRFWDRITRPEQLLSSLPQALRVLTDAAECGPVTLALPQDVQTEAYAYPNDFFTTKIHRPRRLRPDQNELHLAADLIRSAQKPLVIVGGGVHYSEATAELTKFVEKHHLPMAETQAGKGALVWDHVWQMGGIGVTGSLAANTLAQEADLVLALGTRLSDFTTASRSLFANPKLRLISINVASFDAHKHFGQPLVCDLLAGLNELSTAIGDYVSPLPWQERAKTLTQKWQVAVAEVTSPNANGLPTDAQVLGVVNSLCQPQDIVVAAAGGLPGELHKLWQVKTVGSYHLEYGYSCMGYEIAGGLGVKLAHPEREVFVLLGDGSYLMLNSELVTAASMGLKLTVVLLDNHGFGCINRLQKSTGAKPFNNLFAEDNKSPKIDFASHAAAMGVNGIRVSNLKELKDALLAARQQPSTSVIVIDTDPQIGTSLGGAWWDVAVPEVSEHEPVKQARQNYQAMKSKQRIGC